MDVRREAARRALDDVPINVMFARAALDLDAPLWSDRGADPRAFHVVHPYGMSLVWGPDVEGAFPAVVAHLTGRAGEEWLQVEPRWAGLGWDDALGAVPVASDEAGQAGRPGRAAVRHTRVNFAFDPALHRRPAMPAGWAARTATDADFDWPGAVVPSRFWPDAGALAANGGATVVERDGVVGAVAFASYRHGDDVELGIETAPDLRRQGLAAAAASAMVDATLAAGRTPVWSCREDNVGSYRLAVALGFVPTTRGPYVHLTAATVA